MNILKLENEQKNRFKFRAWLIDKKIMVDVSSINIEDQEIYYKRETKCKHPRCSCDDKGYAYFDEAVILQSINTKDYLGKTIYEGDILFAEDEYGEKSKHNVYFEDHYGYKAFEIDPNPCCDANGLSWLMNSCSKCLVIGNIFQGEFIYTKKSKK